MAEKAKTSGEAEPKTRTVTEEEWNRISTALASVEALSAKTEAQARDLEVLRAAADKHRIQAIEDKLKTPGNSIVKLRTIRSEDKRKIVVDWVMLANDAYIDPLTKREVANQQIELVLDDDTRIKLAYNDFSRFTEEKLLAEVVGRQGTTYTVKLLGDERTLTVDAKVLN